MTKMFAKIKKQNGERFAKVIRSYHNGIFEVPNILKIVKHAGRGTEDAEAILNYLVSLVVNESEDKPEPKSPFELLEEAGYDYCVADTAKKQDAIAKYFEKNERLCTFGTSRYQKYHIVNVVRKDVDQIKREDFVGKEKRDDAYGTSVMSIQMAKSGGFISIKNRYNHSVSGCDNTLNSDPDNIIHGLSSALQKHFNVSFKGNGLLPENRMLVDDCVFKYHSEIKGVFYGDHAYYKDGKLIEVESVNNEYLFDIYIFDASKKEFRLVDENVTDSFPEDFNRVYAGRKSIYVKKHCIWDGETMLVGV